MNGPLKTRRELLAMAAAGCVVGTAQAQQAFPSRPVSLVVNAEAGGPTDMLARAVQEVLSAELGQPVVVDNRVGAGGVIGATHVARAQPNGYTLLLTGAGPLVFSPLLNRNVPYDPEKAFTHIGILATLPTLLAVHPSLGVASLSELVALAKRSPKPLTFASSGVATPSHLAGELLRQIAQVELVHVPYRSVPAAALALLNGEVSLGFTGPTSSLPYVKDGRLLGLAVTGPARLKQAPGIPTAQEAGFPALELLGWFGLLAPAGLPPDVYAKIRAAVAVAMDNPKVKATVTASGSEPVMIGSDEFARFTAKERTRWEKVIRAAGIQPE